MNPRLKQIIKVLNRHKITKDYSPANVRTTLEDLGPTFVKIGQVLSTRPDLIPRNYAEEFTKLKDNVKPMPFEEVKRIIAEELGGDDVFVSVDPVPLGSASIAQVHRAKLKDGTDAVVKVMRANIREIVNNDMELFLSAIKYIKLLPILPSSVDLKQMTEEIWHVMERETDFRNEAENLRHMAETNADIKYVAFPKVYDEYTTCHVLTMENINGIKLSDTDKLREEGYDTAEIAQKLVENYMHQALDNGFYHADPHNGNIMVRDGKIVWLDLGMVGVLSESDLAVYRKVVKAVVAEDSYELKDLVLTIVRTTREVDHIGLYRDIDFMLKKHANQAIASFDMAELLTEFMDIVNRHGMILPENVTVLCRAMILLQETVSQLDKSVNLMTVLGNHVSTADDEANKTPQDTLRAIKNAYVSSKKVAMLPTHMSELLMQVLRGEGMININLRNADKTNRTAVKNNVRVSIALLLSFTLIAMVAVLCVLYAVTKLVIYKVLLIIALVLMWLFFFVGVVIFVVMCYIDYKNR